VAIRAVIENEQSRRVSHVSLASPHLARGTPNRPTPVNIIV